MVLEESFLAYKKCALQDLLYTQIKMIQYHYHGFSVARDVVQAVSLPLTSFFITLQRRTVSGELTRQPTAVDRDGIAVNVIRCTGGEENNRPHQVTR